MGSHKTAVFTDSDGALCVVYHKTCVWKKCADGSIVLNTGGYKTRTTKLRMNQAFNQYGPAYYGVVQDDGSWYVYVRGVQGRVPFDGDNLHLPHVVHRHEETA